MLLLRFSLRFKIYFLPTDLHIGTYLVYDIMYI